LYSFAETYDVHFVVWFLRFAVYLSLRAKEVYHDMQRSSLFHVAAFAISTMVLYASLGCDKSPNEANSELSAQDQAAIRQAIDVDEIFNNYGIDDDGDQEVEYSTDGLGKVAEQIDAKRWGRRGRLKRENIEIERTGETTATATVYSSFNGQFYILAKDQSNPNQAGELYKKEMQNTIVRKVNLVKVRDTGNDRLDWRIEQVSGGVMSSPNPTINISNFTIEFPDGAELSLDDPLAYFWNRQDGLPAFAPRDTVKLYVALANSNEFPPEPGETVTLRHGMDHYSHRSRKMFNDNGEYPDAVASDGIYSGFFVAGRRPGLHHGAADAIDNGTIYDDSAPYDALLWSLPYRVKY
jgi:hypothetical protein